MEVPFFIIWLSAKRYRTIWQHSLQRMMLKPFLNPMRSVFPIIVDDAVKSGSAVEKIFIQEYFAGGNEESSTEKSSYVIKLFD